jgi:hypothetical protein
MQTKTAFEYVLCTALKKSSLEQLGVFRDLEQDEQAWQSIQK